MEIYSKKYEYICSYAAKSGSSSLRRLFLEIHGDELGFQKPDSYHDLEMFFPLPKGIVKKKVWKLVLVRNPYSRIVSAFFNRYLGCDWAIRKSLEEYGLLDQEDFLCFLRKLREIRDHGEIDHFDIHVRRQTFGIDLGDPMTLIVNLEKFHNQISGAYSIMFGEYHPITSKVRSILERSKIHENPTHYGGPIKNAHRKIFIKGEMPPHFSKMYDPETKFIVDDVYEDDFFKLGYPSSIKQCMFL